MQDRPSAAEILEAVARTLRSGAPLSQFGQRVCASAVDIARREISEPRETREAENARLTVLLSETGSTEALTCRLAERIVSGELDEATPGLLEHLWLTTLEKVAVDQPGFAMFRRLNAADRPGRGAP